MANPETQSSVERSLKQDDRVGPSGAHHRWRPPAHHIRVCVLSTCEADTGHELTRALAEQLGIGFDERTADGTIALEGLECIGLCGIRQAVLIDDEPVVGRDAVLRAVAGLLQHGSDQAS